MFSNNKYEQLVSAVKEAAAIFKNADLTEINQTEKSSFRDICTQYDVKVQEYLFSKLSEIFPDSEFIGEESEANAFSGKGTAIIIDPIDGTSNFARGYCHSCVSVALAIDGITELGVVYNPYLDELFYAEKNKGAYLNGRKIKISAMPLNRSIVGFGTAPYCPELSDLTIKLVGELYKNGNDIRRTGSAALDLCYLASGRIDFFFELSLYPWDYAAGALIVEEAGGVVLTADLQPLLLNKKCSVAGGEINAVKDFSQIYKNFLN